MGKFVEKRWGIKTEAASHEDEFLLKKPTGNKFVENLYINYLNVKLYSIEPYKTVPLISYIQQTQIVSIVWFQFIN